MNRNTNAHFSELPSVDIKRSRFDRSFSHKLSGNVGDIIPIFYDDILPGDTVSMDTTKVIRFQTLLTPMMDQIYADVYWFFVPNRLVWDHWINFMGENTSSAWVSETEYQVPQITVPPHGATTTTGSVSLNNVGTILDYLGYPVESSAQQGDVKINALPIRGYAKICQDWFADENIKDPLNIYTGDALQSAYISSTQSYIDEVPLGGKPYIAAKFADYFTSGLPAPQKGNAVAIRMSEYYAPVFTHNVDVFGDSIPVLEYPLVTNGPAGTDGSFYYIKSAAGSNNVQKAPGAGSATFDAAVTAGTSDTGSISPRNLWADLSHVPQLFNVNDLRMAFQMQKLLERDARGGTRYIEVIKSHFAIDSPDQRLQRSEYLGGNRFTITVNQVANQAQSEQDFLGDLGAYSVTADSHSDFTKSFTEHGMLFGLLVLRYDHTYSQGLEKFWQRKSRFDYYWPVFANIGEQPINVSEIYLKANSDNSTNQLATFAYQEAWADYRYKPNRVSGELRPYVSNGLYSWTLADNYSEPPSLSSGWIDEAKSNVDRVLAVTSEVSHQFWADFYFNFYHTRPMPVYSIPGLIDHN